MVSSWKETLVGAPDEICDLINRFGEQYDSYRLPEYNETQLRREFIDPFFKALGWDVDNEQGYAEAYKEVIHEDSVKIGASTKAPDYSFRIGGVRKFFVETKKPAVKIGQDASPAYQLRRYAWSAKLPLSILTDFEEFAVYDCRVRPDKNDKASTARTLLLNYEQYEDRWDEIASIFSRDAILKGSFDKYAESNKKKRGTAEVDNAFLKEIEDWRSDLSRNLALRNKELSQREINSAVQKTIDRIIFLRICEDRGIEVYGRLQALLNGAAVYPRLCELFRDADTKYNSGLFHFHAEKGRTEPPDEWTLGLNIDDASRLVSAAELKDQAPMTFGYLQDCRSRLNQRENGRFRGASWYQYGRPQNHERFEVPEKIIMGDVAARGECCLDKNQMWLLDTCYAITPMDHVWSCSALVGILNSRILTLYLKETGTPLRGGYFRMKTSYLKPFPIPEITHNDSNKPTLRQRIAELVDEMHQLHTSITAAKTSHERTALSRQIATTDREIDALVYELYGLTEAEIRLVEDATKT